MATDGRPLGIHLVVTGDRPNSVPASLLASIQRRLVLRLTSEDDYEQVDLDVLPAGSPDFPVIGVDDETLQPAAIMAQGPLLLAGPPGAGRTVALVTLAYALRRSNPDTELVYIGRGPARDGVHQGRPVGHRGIGNINLVLRLVPGPALQIGTPGPADQPGRHRRGQPAQHVAGPGQPGVNPLDLRARGAL